MERALIIEDDKDISDLMAIHLADLEFEVDKAFDGKDRFVYPTIPGLIKVTITPL